MIADEEFRIQMIPIDQITVLNPRVRGKRKFSQIVSNIAKLGLKKPVTVAPLEGKNGDGRYLLVCGQGRLEAYAALNQTEIPAVVVHGSKDKLLLMSLAENLARRQHSPVELVREISVLKDRGYTIQEIATKTDLNATYVRGFIQLLAKGETQLLVAVEKGQIPVSIAVIIATANDKAVQRALTDAYERNDLRGKALLRARRLIEARRLRGKRKGKSTGQASEKVSADSLLRTYKEETIRQKLLVEKAKMCDARLRFAVTAIQQLFRDEAFTAIVRAEGLDSVPQYLAEKIHVEGVSP
ncbi:MAG: ParB N-terminal domain-containing protein [Pirellulales bacterium]|nr:ParB N-terminal domain-containing protein [Pirellulales bacterium]